MKFYKRFQEWILMMQWSRILSMSLLFILFIGILAGHAWYYLPFFSDDALISLQYAKRFIEGNGLTWTEGRPVEGYSNLLWILFVALMGKMGGDLILAARILGFVSLSAVVFILMYWHVRWGNGPPARVPLLFGIGFFIAAAPVGVWAIGGLEHPLFCAALSCAILFLWRFQEEETKGKQNILAASFALGLMCITRPDGPLFTGAALIALSINRVFFHLKKTWRTFLLLPLFPMIFVFGQILFRWQYYGELLPNPAFVKIHPAPYHFANGLEYVLRGFLVLSPFSELTLIFIFWSFYFQRFRNHGMLFLSFLLSWSAYLVFIGGDIFPAFRHFLPLLCLMAFVLIKGSAELWRNADGKSYRYRFLTGAALMMLFVPFFVFHYSRSEFSDAKNETWEWKGRALGTILKKAFSKQQPLLAVTAAGCLPYWSDIPCLDMLGLNNYDIPRLTSTSMEYGLLGHELGNASYVLNQKPDIICFNVGENPEFNIGAQLTEEREFRERYALVKIQGETVFEYVGVVWFRKESEKIGIQRRETYIRIPAFLFNGYRHTFAFLHKDALAISIDAESPAGIMLEGIPDAHWKIRVTGTDVSRIESSIVREGRKTHVFLKTKSREPVIVERVELLNEPG